MKKLLVLTTLVFGLSTLAPAYAGGSMGGNPSCDSGAVNVGHAPCGKKVETDKSNK
jgi:hypothetical protein